MPLGGPKENAVPGGFKEDSPQLGRQVGSWLSSGQPDPQRVEETHEWFARRANKARKTNDPNYQLYQKQYMDFLDFRRNRRDDEEAYERDTGRSVPRTR